MAPTPINLLRTKIAKIYYKWLDADYDNVEEAINVKDQYEDLLIQENDQELINDSWLIKIKNVVQYFKLNNNILAQIDVLTVATNPRMIQKGLKKLEETFEIFKRLSQQSIELETKLIDLKCDIDLMKEDLSQGSRSPSTDNGSNNSNNNVNANNANNNNVNGNSNNGDNNNDNVNTNNANNNNNVNLIDISFSSYNSVRMINNGHPNQRTFISNEDKYTDVPIQKVSLKQFSGNIMEYRDFRLNAHRLIINNRRIPDPIDKLRCLKEALPTNIKYHLSHLGANPGDLAKAIEILDKVCGSPAAMSSHLLQQLQRIPNLQLDSPMKVLLEYRNWIVQALTVINDHITEESKLMNELKRKISRQVRQFGFRNLNLTAEAFQTYIEGAVNTEYDYTY